MRASEIRYRRLFEATRDGILLLDPNSGLTIVRKAVERMGAQLGLQSHLGKRSKFWILLTKG
jgi:PAS domain-containing protein